MVTKALKIGVLGLWHQGIVLSACLASKKINVIGFDNDPNQIKILNSGKSPIYEPGLNDLLNEKIFRNQLKFSEDLEPLVENSDLIFLSHDIPINDEDEMDCNEFLKDFSRVIELVTKPLIIVITAQISIALLQKLKDEIQFKSRYDKIEISYIPENLRLGQAIRHFENPGLPIIGAPQDQEYQIIKSIMPQSKKWVRCSIETAVMLKHALNCFLATTINFSNEIDTISRKVGADGNVVMKLLKLDPRISSKLPLSPGLGFAGGTLARDVKELTKISKELNLPELSINSVHASNGNRNKMLIDNLINICREKRIQNVGVFGLTYKSGTSTLRRSISIEFMDAMCAAGVDTTFYEKNVLEILEKNLLKKYNSENDQIALLNNSDLICIFNDDNTLCESSDISCLNLRKTILYIFDPYKFLQENDEWRKSNKVCFV